MKNYQKIIFYLNALKMSIGGGIVASIPLMLVFGLITLPMFQKKIETAKKKSVQIAVDSVFKIFDFYYEQEKKGQLSREQAQKMAALQIRLLRYDKDEYFWIHDTQMKMVMHAMKPELEGKDLSDFKDPQGKRIFFEMVKVAQNSGSGFVEYMWPKPGSKDSQPKTSFVKLFSPWGWIIGNGVYADDIKTEVSRVRAENFFWLTWAVLAVVLISLLIGAQQFVKVIMPVQEVIKKLRDETSNLMKNAKGLNETSQKLSSAEQTNASSIHETVTAMTEMNAMISKTAESANLSSSLAGDTQSLVQNSLGAIKAWGAAMAAIAEAQRAFKLSVQDNVNRIQAITSIMNQISEKTKLINEIVFQTKLLSFNASVEAARAGDAGKGFSVVAEEVGNLAQLSGKISTEISLIVSDSHKRVADLAESVSESLGQVIKQVSHSVNEGIQSSEKSLNLLNRVVEIAGKSSEMANSISSANSEQSKGTQEAMDGLRMIEQMSQNLSRVVQQTDSISSELLTRANELDGMTETLNKIISTDQLKQAA